MSGEQPRNLLPGQYDAANRRLKNHLIPLNDTGRINLEKLHELRQDVDNQVIDRYLPIPDFSVKTAGKRVERDMGQLRREMWRDQHPGEQDPPEPQSRE